MCSSNECLIYYLFLVLIIFYLIIYFLLKYRKYLQEQYLKITADQVWESAMKQIACLNLSKANLLFAVWQDVSTTTMSLIVKDANNEIVGQVFTPTGTRKKTIKIGEQFFLIEFPFTWNRTAILHAPNGAGIIAKYVKTNWLGHHKFDLIRHGELISESSSANLRATFNYKLNGNLIGTCQNISTAYEKGRLLILPSNLPIEIRIFILAV